MATISVPDLEALCRLFLVPSLTSESDSIFKRMVFGGQMDPYDFHLVGLSYDFHDF